jgi:hypothetical protein
LCQIGGNIVKSLFERTHKVYLLSKEMTPLSSHFEDDTWLYRLNLHGDGTQSVYLSEETVSMVRTSETGNVAEFPTLTDSLEENSRN